MMKFSDLLFATNKSEKISSDEAISGRDQEIETATDHYVLNTPLKGPYPQNTQTLYVGMGCFWGAERLFWQLDGVYTTAVGYMGGYTKNPSYEETCSGKTGHTEAVMIVFDPTILSIEKILKIFYEEHNPTQGMRQGNDVGSQYRSALYWTSEDQKTKIEHATTAYQIALNDKNMDAITTELGVAGPFYFAETYHQQYLAKNPGGYCGLKGTGVACVLS